MERMNRLLHAGDYSADRAARSPRNRRASVTL
jgi:hypothetical protein